MKTLSNGQYKLGIISNNCRAIRKTQLDYMAILGGSKVNNFDGNNYELGTTFSRMHRVCMLDEGSGPWRFGYLHCRRQLSGKERHLCLSQS